MKLSLMGVGSRVKLRSSTVLAAALGVTLTVVATPALTATIDNTATVSGYSPAAVAAGAVSPDVSNTGSETIIIEDLDPTFTLVKSAGTPTNAAGADTSSPDAGDTITYSFVFTNTGNVTLDGTTIAISDDAPTFNGVPATNALGALTLTPVVGVTDDDEVGLGESWTYTALYTMSQADVDNAAGVTSGVSNTVVSVAVNTTGGAPGVIDPDPAFPSTLTAVTDVPANAALTVAKVALRGAVPDDGSVTPYALGETVTYQFTVANEGNVTMSGITVADTAFGGAGSLSAIACTISTDDTIASLAPGATETCTATYVIQEADL